MHGTLIASTNTGSVVLELGSVLNPFSLKRYYPIYGSCGKPINSTKMMKLDRVDLNETAGLSQRGMNTPLMNIDTSNLQRACNRAATLCGTSNFSCIRDRSGDKNCQFLRNIPGYFLEFLNIFNTLGRIQSLQWKSKQYGSSRTWPYRICGDPTVLYDIASNLLITRDSALTSHVGDYLTQSVTYSNVKCIAYCAYDAVGH